MCDVFIKTIINRLLTGAYQTPTTKHTRFMADNLIACVKTLFDQLPDSLPCPELNESDYALLYDFHIDPAVLQRTDGDVPWAVAQSIWALFEADGEVIVEERGPAISSVTLVLSHYLGEFPGDPRLTDWVAHLKTVLEVYYRENNLQLPNYPVDSGQDQAKMGLASKSSEKKCKKQGNENDVEIIDDTKTEKHRKEDKGLDTQAVKAMPKQYPGLAILNDLVRKPTKSGNGGPGNPGDPVLQRLTYKYTHKVSGKDYFS
ncbi:hypothetical protein DXG01_001914, partial [Tephrocybe rancida]